jgi:hypothetical protein
VVKRGGVVRLAVELHGGIREDGALGGTYGGARAREARDREEGDRDAGGTSVRLHGLVLIQK